MYVCIRCTLNYSIVRLKVIVNYFLLWIIKCWMCVCNQTNRSNTFTVVLLNFHNFFVVFLSYNLILFFKLCLFLHPYQIVTIPVIWQIGNHEGWTRSRVLVQNKGSLLSVESPERTFRLPSVIWAHSIFHFGTKEKCAYGNIIKIRWPIIRSDVLLYCVFISSRNSRALNFSIFRI